MTQDWEATVQIQNLEYLLLNDEEAYHRATPEHKERMKANIEKLEPTCVTLQERKRVLLEVIEKLESVC